MQDTMTRDENRRSNRESFRRPVTLELSASEGDLGQTLLGHTINVNKHGIALHVASQDSITSDTDLVINIDSSKYIETLKLPGKVVWTSDAQWGIKFHQELRDLSELIHHTSVQYQIQSTTVKKFFPYIHGDDIDTQRYEFYPYIDMFLKEPENTRHCMFDLKHGRRPSDLENYIYAQYAVGDSRLNHQAMFSAYHAFNEYRRFSLTRRRKIIDDIRENLIRNKETIIQLLMIEGHPRKLADWEYSGMVIGCSPKSLDYFESEILKVVMKSDKETLINIRRPEGVFCVCPPSNASCSNSLTAILALLAGNTLIVKPPLTAPVSTIYLWRHVVVPALEQNASPKGTVNIIVGNSKQFMNDWLESPYVRGIIFFNDSAKGIDVGTRAYQNGKKPILELSGNDYMVIWKDADIDRATDSLIDCFMGSTQICMVPKKAIIHDSIYNSFMTVFLKKVNSLKFGLPTDPETILSPVQKIKEFFHCLDDALLKGATLLSGGYRVDHDGIQNDNGFYIYPTVIEVPAERMNMIKCVQEENFFPLLPVIKITGGGLTVREKDRNIYDEMLEILEKNPYGLRISVWVSNQYYLRKFLEDVHYSGLLRINSRHIGFSECLSTHGGIGKTGGPFGEMNYIWQKTSHLQGITLSSPDPTSGSSPNLELLREDTESKKNN